MSVEEYKAEGAELFAEVKRLIFEEKNWTLRKKNHDIELYSTKTPYCSKCECVKAEHLIKMPPRQVMDVMNAFGPYRYQFDHNLSQVKLLKEISDHLVVAHKIYELKYLPIVPKTDAVDIIFVKEVDGDYYSACKSTKLYDESGLDVKNNHRVWEYPTAMVAFKTENPNESKIVALWHIDINLPKVVPKTLVDKIFYNSHFKFMNGLFSMADKPYKPLGPEIPFCRNR